MTIRGPRGARRERLRDGLTVAALTVLLNACGGGGGGDAGGGSAAPLPPPAPSPAPAPSPTLTLTATATATTAGGHAIALHASSSGGGSLTWTLSGPGALSATSGNEVSYAPPDAQSLDDDATVTVKVATPGATSQQVALAVASAGLPGRHWTVTRAGSPGLGGITYGNGLFLATRSPTPTTWGLAYSTDGVHWTQGETPTQGWLMATPAWGAAGWVSVEAGGAAFTSRDGKSWNWTPNAVPASMGQVTYGNGTYVASGYGVSQSAVSTDGVHWTTVNQRLDSVAFGDGMFLGGGQDPAVNYGSTLPNKSTDGIHWTPVTQPDAIRDFAFANGQFVAYGTSATLWATTDGSTWVGTSNTDVHGGGLQAAGNALFELDTDDMGVLLPQSGWQRVSTGSDLSQPNSIAFDGTRYVGVSSTGWITTSPDGLQWTTQVQGGYGDIWTIDFFDGQFTAFTSYGRALRSSDGAHWQVSQLAPGVRVGIHGVAHSQGTTVAVGGNFGAVAFRSTDGGASWTPATLPLQTMGLSGVVYDGHRFVAITFDGGIYASADGSSWSRLSTAPVDMNAAVGMDGIAYGAGTFFIYGTTKATSPDGVNWTKLDPSVFVGSSAPDAYISGVLWDGNRFVVTGRPINATGTPSQFSAVSADGRHWVSHAMAYDASSLVYCGGQYVGMGDGYSVSSADGVNWHQHLDLQNGAQTPPLSCGNGLLVSVDAAGSLIVSNH